MKYLALFFGACLGLAGCVVETTGSGGSGGTGGGSGGNGGSGAEGGGGSGVGGGTTTDTATGGGGSGGGGDCLTCGVYITPGEEGELCAGPSTDLYNALADCTCGSDLMGMGAKCYEACMATACTGASPDGDCLACIQDTNAGCGTEFNECSNDI